MAVVHEFYGGGIRGDGHDGDDGAEGLVAHDGHVVGDVGEEGGFDEVSLLGHVFEAGVWRGLIPRAGFDGFVDLGEDCFLGALGDDGPDLGGSVHGITDSVVGEDGLAGVDEGVVDIVVDVDALDGAAGLAGVEDGAVDDFFGGPSGIHVWPDICWVFAAKLETDIDYSVCGCFLNGETAGDGPGEADMVDFWGADD